MVTSTVDVHLRERQVLFVAPDNEGTRRWGVYGCPDMYRAEDDSIVVYDDGQMDTYDSEAAKCPAVCFRSGDSGLTWASFARELREGDGLPGKVFRLADGGRAQFLPRGPVNLAALGVAPRGMAISANEYGLIGLFRLGDLPPEARSFTVRYRPRGAEEWRSDDAVFDMPDVQIAATLKAKTGAAVWPDVTPTISALLNGNSGLPDGTTSSHTGRSAIDAMGCVAAQRWCPDMDMTSVARHILEKLDEDTFRFVRPGTKPPWAGADGTLEQWAIESQLIDGDSLTAWLAAYWEGRWRRYW